MSERSKKYIKIPYHYIYVGLLILCLLGRGSAWSICMPNIAAYTLMVFVLSTIIFLVSVKGKISVQSFRRNYEPILLIAMLIPSMLVHISGNNLTLDLMLIFSILSVYFITLPHNKSQLFILFIDVMYLICVLSLICYAMFNILNIPKDWMLLLSKNNESRGTYRSILIYSIRLGDVIRNCGPFWEPSIMAAYTIVALILQLFYLKIQDKKKITVFTAAIISTFSSGGIVLLFLVFLMWVWRNRKGHRATKVLTACIAVLIVFSWDVVSNWLLRINYDMFSKLTAFTTSKSSMSRIYSILINFEIWSKSIVFGVGQSQVDVLYQTTKSSDLALTLLQLRPSQSATPFIFLAAFGVPGIYYSFLWGKAIVRFNVLSGIQKVLFAAIILFILTETPHTHFMLSYYILFALLHKDFYGKE